MKLLQTSLAATALALIGTGLLSGCGGGDDDAAGWHTEGEVKLKFVAVAGDTPIACGSPVDAIGSTAKRMRVQDLRFFISNVHLIGADGTRVPLTLDRTDDFNYASAEGSVSLIDLEQKDVDRCISGSPAINAEISGTVPAGRYLGVAMELGVPQALNHSYSLDPKTPAVLRTDLHPGMSWNWRGGRKFTKIELIKDPADTTAWDSDVTLLHLGSTGCVGDPAKGEAVTGCTAPNRLPFALDGFDPGHQAIAFDVQALFAGDDVSKGTHRCMAGPTDASCVLPFKALGLDFNPDGSGNGQPAAGQTQTVFKAVAKS